MCIFSSPTHTHTMIAVLITAPLPRLFAPGRELQLPIVAVAFSEQEDCPLLGPNSWLLTGWEDPCLISSSENLDPGSRVEGRQIRVGRGWVCGQASPGKVCWISLQQVGCILIPISSWFSPIGFGPIGFVPVISLAQI